MGGTGSDVYVWNIGDGNDRISDTGSSGLGDTLLLGPVNDNASMFLPARCLGGRQVLAKYS